MMVLVDSEELKSFISESKRITFNFYHHDTDKDELIDVVAFLGKALEIIEDAEDTMKKEQEKCQ